MKFHEIFEEAAELYSDRPFLQFEDQKPLAYAEALERATQVSKALVHEHELKPGARVVAHLMRSIDHVILLIALSKIGAIYVPIAADCPTHRRDDILQDIEPDLIVANHTSTVYPIDTTVVQCSKLYSQGQQLAEAAAAAAQETNSIAYVCYTSGTTGKPKGVAIEHGGFKYWADIIRDQTKMTTDRIVLGNISYGFDAHIWEIIMAISGGAKLCIIDDQTRLSHSIIDYMSRQGITDATFVPTVIANLDNNQLLAIESLKAIYSTGEACSAAFVVNCEKSGINFFNCYGPTELTFGMSMVKCTKGYLDKSGRAPVGVPVGEVKAYILDPEGVPVAKGVPGHLHVASPYMTPGYWNRLEETNAAIVTKSLDGQKGLRLYATNDKFVESNGQLFYLGRMSLKAAVKIHGVLVNPLEVEQTIRAVLDQEIANVAVVPIADELRQGNFLVAFIQPKGKALTEIEALRHRLNISLLPSARPAKFVILETFPTTPNGKTDRSALADIYHEKREFSSSSFLIPIEESLLPLFSQILGVDSKAIRHFDTFFTLGGNSLKLTILLNEIEQHFNIKLDQADLYAIELTIFNVASMIHKKRWEKAPLEANRLVKGSSDTNNIFMIAPVTGDGSAVYQPLAERLTASMTSKPNVYCLNTPGLRDPSDISRNANLMAELFANTISTIQNTGTILILSWSSGGVFSWLAANMLERRGRKVHLIMLDSICPLVFYACNAAKFYPYLMQLVTSLLDQLNLARPTPSEEVKLCGSTKRQVDHVFTSVLRKNRGEKGKLPYVKALQAYAIVRGFLDSKNIHFDKLSSRETTLIKCSGTKEDVKSLDTGLDDDALTSLGWGLTGMTRMTLVNGFANHNQLLTKDLPELVQELEKDLSRHDISTRTGSPTGPGAQVISETELQALRSIYSKLTNPSDGGSNPPSRSSSIGGEDEHTKDAARNAADASAATSRAALMSQRKASPGSRRTQSDTSLASGAQLNPLI